MNEEEEEDGEVSAGSLYGCWLIGPTLERLFIIIDFVSRNLSLDDFPWSLSGVGRAGERERRGSLVDWFLRWSSQRGCFSPLSLPSLSCLSHLLRLLFFTWPGQMGAAGSSLLLCRVPRVLLLKIKSELALERRVRGQRGNWQNRRFDLAVTLLSSWSP